MIPLISLKGFKFLLEKCNPNLKVVVPTKDLGQTGRGETQYNEKSNQVDEDNNHKVISHDSRDYFDFIDNLPQIVFETDKSGKITFVNRKAFELFGYSRRDLEKGLSALDIIAPSDQELARENINRVLNGENLGGNRYQIRKKDGTLFPGLIYSQMMKLDEKPAGLRGLIVDLTSQEQTEKALAESEEKFRMAFENAADMIIWADPQTGILLNCNPAAERLIGYSREELIGQPNLVIHPPDKSEEYKARFKEQAENPEKIFSDTEIMTKDGRVIPTEVKASIMEIGGRSILQGIFHDVSRRVKIEEALRDSEQRYLSILRAVPTGIGVTIDRTITFLGKKILQITGYTSEELIGKSSRVLFPSQEEYERIGKFGFPKQESEGSDSIDTNILRKDGSSVDIVLSSSPIDPNDPSKGYTFSIMDITDRKRALDEIRASEEKYRTLFEWANDAIFLLDQGIFVDCNQKGLELLDCTREYILGKTPFEISPPSQPDGLNSKEKALKLIQAALDGAPQHFEWTHLRSDGSQVEVEMKLSPVEYEGRTQLIAISRDITARKRLAKERMRIQKLESIKLLAGGVAHDFNNILVGILGNVNLLQIEEGLSPEILTFLQEIEHATIHARDLTRQLLTFSRSGSPTKEISSIGQIVAEAVSFLMRGRKSTYLLNIEEELPSVEIDPSQITQVLHNLLLNALQAMPEGGHINIRVESSTLSDDRGMPIKSGDYILMSIQDEGAGIKPEHISRIFDPYFSTKKTGNGLGLATAYSIIHNHGGHITFETKLGKGTIFYVYLPVSEASSKTPVNSSPRDKFKGKILILDDEVNIRGVLKKMLEKLGFTVELAETGEEVLHIFSTRINLDELPDAVILDLTIPGGLGGKEILPKLLEKKPDLVAVVTSGYANDPTLANFEKFGFRGVLTKPFTVVQLQELLANWF